MRGSKREGRMRIGLFRGATPGQDQTIDEIAANARDAEARGLASVWVPTIFGLDAISVLTAVGRETERIELATSVVPTYPRHPIAMAQQALTAQAASRGRFSLGIGLSHQMVIESMFGLSFGRPARHMREYVQVLAPLLRGERSDCEGDEYRVHAQLQVPGASSVPLLLAALGPTMLEIAGTLAEGTITWVTGPKTLETHIGPAIRKAAERAGRPEPRVIAGLPIAITANPAGARELAGQIYAMYGHLPSYRAMLDREGFAGPADTALVGDEETVAASLLRLRDAGVTDFAASPFLADEGAIARTVDFLEARKGDVA
jgi:F420-dependent oxidoreductase-like protein